MVDEMVNEKCDGNRNIIHKAVSMCLPKSAATKPSGSSKASDKESLAQGELTNLVKVWFVDYRQQENPDPNGFITRI